MRVGFPKQRITLITVNCDDLCSGGWIISQWHDFRWVNNFNSTRLAIFVPSLWDHDMLWCVAHFLSDMPKAARQITEQDKRNSNSYNKTRHCLEYLLEAHLWALWQCAISCDLVSRNRPCASSVSPTCNLHGSHNSQVSLWLLSVLAGTGSGAVHVVWTVVFSHFELVQRIDVTCLLETMVTLSRYMKTVFFLYFYVFVCHQVVTVSIYLSINLAIYLSIHPSIDLSVWCADDCAYYMLHFVH